MNEQIMKNRNFMKCPAFADAMTESDQNKGVRHPPHGKQMEGAVITLPPFDNVAVENSYQKLLDIRRSVRNYDEKVPMTQAQLAFMLYTAQGIQSYRGEDDVATLRPVPSGGARHPFETYIAVRNVEGLEAGLYYYAPAANIGEKKVAVTYLGPIEDYDNQISEALAGQKWAIRASVVLFFTCIPYRSEWRYKEAAQRVMLIDLGHVGQNVMLSAASLGLGSCCMAAYVQALCDKVLKVDGVDEYTVYAVSVGLQKH